MKKIVTYISSLLIILSSCNLDLAPENTMVDQTVYKNKNTAEAALLGAYVRLNIALSGGPIDQNYYPSSGDAYIFGDMGTDNLKAQSTASDYLAMETGEYSENEHNGMLINLWRRSYNGIDYANNIIAGITKYGEYDSKTMNQHIAEAKFIRSFIYFQLLMIYGDQALMGNDTGLGVVKRVEPYEGYDPEEVITRSTNAESWEMIINDLKEAMPYLPEKAPAAVEQRLRATQSVAKALLSRIYLYKGTFTNNEEELTLAMNYAKEVIDGNEYQFSNDYKEYTTNLFPENYYNASDEDNITQPTNRSNEIIFFEASRLKEDLYPSGIYMYYAKRSLYVPDAMKSYYEEGDVRGYNADAESSEKYLLGQGSKTENASLITSLKYTNSNSADYNNDVIYFRLAEMKLTYAEALTRVRKAVTQEAVNELNDIHQRAYITEKKPDAYTTGSFGTPDLLIKEILLERNKEFAYEGMHRWDIIRTNNLLDDQTMKKVAPNRWNAPIPSYEIEISNGNIKQNSGY